MMDERSYETHRAFHSLEAAVVMINKDIFMDLGWQHLAYDQYGIKEIREAHDRGELTDESLGAWEDIDSGDGHRVAAGNLTHLLREQRDIAPAGYLRIIELERGFAAQLSAQAGNPIPGGIPFRRSQPTGDLTAFADRWKWIENDIFGVWAWMTPAGREHFTSMSLDELSREAQK